MTPEITNLDDVIDSRDVIARIEELEDMRDDAGGAWGESAEADELTSLTALAAEAGDYAGDWIYGATLVRYSYFTEYARDLVEDVGDLPRTLPDYIVVDWEATARNIKADYASVDFGGVEYWVR